MSFMYNPFPYDDPKPVNRPELSEDTIKSIVKGSDKAAAVVAADIADRMKAGKENVIIGFDGYTTACWKTFLNLLGRRLTALGIGIELVDFDKEVFKSGEEIDAMIDPLLEWDTKKDPTLLFGKIYKGGYEGFIDPAKAENFRKKIAAAPKGKVTAVFGYGSLIKDFRGLYDIKCYFDVTPKESMLRIRRGRYANIGHDMPDLTNRVIRRCYYCDFEAAVHNRGDLLQNNILDYYFESDHDDEVRLIPVKALNEIFNSLADYPFRCKPVYLEGVWGGTYMKKLRNLPDTMRNCAWVFDFIPMEVSILVQAGDVQIDFPYFTFVQKEGVKIMGEKCVKRYQGYFPIRFNYDDSYHSTGNMSIQCHSGAAFNKSEYNEFGRQDESYYVVVTGHDAKTFLGFRDDADIDQFCKDIEAADTQHKPVDYMKYVSYEESKPGLQVMIPAGTVHSSGRNQVVLEIGSLTIGSYTYKMYDYLRLDFDGKQRPIHTYLGEKTIVRDRRTSWVRGNIVQKPRLADSGEGWEEYIIGESDLLYFSLRRLEFEQKCYQETKGIFHVLTVVDGEKVRVRSVGHPERFYEADYMDIVVVPADMGRYVIENLGKEPIRIHKTMLRDGFENDPD